ncbi:hypothetical protein GCM10027275_19660 [Rhabdobacter roseus]
MSLLALLSFLAVTSCSPRIKVLQAEKSEDFRLSDYPTFGFYEIEASGDTTPGRFLRNVGAIKLAIIRELEGRGLTQSNDPALRVNIGIVVNEEIQTRQTDFRTDGIPRYMGQRRYSWRSQEVEVGRYREGTLSLELVDARQNHMVWHGAAEGSIPSNERRREAVIDQAVHELLKEVR